MNRAGTGNSFSVHVVIRVEGRVFECATGDPKTPRIQALEKTGCNAIEYLTVGWCWHAKGFHLPLVGRLE